MPKRVVSGNIDNIVKSLTNNYIKINSNSEFAKDVKAQLQKVAEVKAKLDERQAKIKNFNAARMRISKYKAYTQEVQAVAKKFKVSNEVLESVTKKGDNYFNRYREGRYEEDSRVIKNYYSKLANYTKEGYKVLTDLRQMFTGQTIIGAIDYDKGQTHFHSYVHEENLLKAFYLSTPNFFDDDGKIKMMNSIEDFTLRLMGESIYKKQVANTMGSGIIVSSSDPFYELMGKVMDASQNTTDKSEILQNYDAWEIYTDARAYFGKDNVPSLDVFSQWFFATRHIKKLQDQALYYSKGQELETKERSMQYLPFYSGGDSTYNNNVLIQNKSGRAEISITSVYNGLKYALTAFRNFPKMDEKIVAALFTADLSNIPQEIENTAFVAAQRYALKTLQDRVKILNSM